MRIRIQVRIKAQLDPDSGEKTIYIFAQMHKYREINTTKHIFFKSLLWLFQLSLLFRKQFSFSLLFTFWIRLQEVSYNAAPA